MPDLYIVSTGQCLSYTPGQTLMEILTENELDINNACNGKGTCGKCKVTVNGEERLACLTIPEGQEQVELLQTAKADIVLAEGKVPDFHFQPSDKADWDTPYGLAADIGTTTVVVMLVNLCTGEKMSASAMVNEQKKYGQDVLSRITYEVEQGKKGVAALQKVMIDQLNTMIAEVCEKAAVAPDSICEFVVAANCTMLHMLLGINAAALGRAPYVPEFVEARTTGAAGLGLHLPADVKLYCLPSVSAYIGADIVAGSYVAGLHKEDGNVLFVDIGTNGEMVLTKGGTLFCCSCAAGPALEGMNISCGMRAAEGAVEAVSISETGVKLKVIGDGTPAGICGSGILSAVSELLQTGIVRPKGVFVKKEQLAAADYRQSFIHMNGKKRAFALTTGESPLLITQSDVRQVQLAKGAVLSGILALLEQSDVKLSELHQVVVAGQFGRHLSEESLIGTGIIPGALKGKITYIGNSSGAGAYMALMSLTVREEMEALAGRMEYIELGMTEEYERLFAECLIFPE